MESSTLGSSASRSGIVTFAGVMFCLAGIFNVIYGLVSILNTSYLTDSTLFADIKVWGWVMLIFGVGQLVVGGAIIGRKMAGMFVGLVLAAAGALFHLAFIVAFPVWSIIIMFLYAVIIYALTVHGEEFE